METNVKQPAAIPDTKPGQRRKIIMIKMIVAKISITPNGTKAPKWMRRLLK